MIKNNKIIFISWVPYNRRSETLSENLGCEVFFIDYLFNKRKVTWKLFWWIDYINKCIRTLKIFLSKKPHIVFVQNPPTVSLLATYFYQMISGCKIVVDSHNGAFESPWNRFPFSIQIFRKSEVVLVHNKQLFNYLSKEKKYKAINFFVLNDKIPEFKITKQKDSDRKYFFVITSFSNDEPVEEILEGIKFFLLRSSTNYNFKISGNYEKKTDLYKKYSRNPQIQFLGFIDDNDYQNELMGAYGTISMSNRDMVQQCALMETIGCNVPFISSDNLTNRDFFGEKMILTQNVPVNIAASIELFIKEKKTLQKNMAVIKNELNERWNKDYKGLKEIIGI